MQLCAGDEFLFPLAKPSSSFQNLTETPPGKRVLLSFFCFSKILKVATEKKENRLTNKTFTPKTILATSFSIVKMLADRFQVFHRITSNSRRRESRELGETYRSVNDRMFLLTNRK